MLITKSQGRACRLAAERIAEGRLNADLFSRIRDCYLSVQVIGWCSNVPHEKWAFDRNFYLRADENQVLLALLWCAELGARGDPDGGA